MLESLDRVWLRRFLERLDRLYPRVLTQVEVVGKLLREITPENIPEVMDSIPDDIREAIRERTATYPTDDYGWERVEVPWLNLTMNPIPEEHRVRDR
jgi:hypothetical protein